MVSSSLINSYFFIVSFASCLKPSMKCFLQRPGWLIMAFSLQYEHFMVVMSSCVFLNVWLCVAYCL